MGSGLRAWPRPGLAARGGRRAGLLGRRRRRVRGPGSDVPRPAGSAALLQAVFADDYRGATVSFSGEIRADPLTGQSELRLEINRSWWRAEQAREDHGLTIAGRCPWTRYEITARIPADADQIRLASA